MRDAFPKKTKDAYFSMEKERALFENGRRPKHFLGGQILLQNMPCPSTLVKCFGTAFTEDGSHVQEHDEKTLCSRSHPLPFLPSSFPHLLHTTQLSNKGNKILSLDSRLASDFVKLYKIDTNPNSMTFFSSQPIRLNFLIKKVVNFQGLGFGG